MFDIWGFLLQTLTASGVAILLLIIKAIFRDKLPPKWHFAVWGVLGLILLVPAGMDGRYTLVRWQLMVEWIKSWCGDYSFTQVLFPIPIPILQKMPKTLMDWLFIGYIAGVLGCTAKYVFSYLRLRHAVRSASRPCVEKIDRIQQMAAVQKMKACRIAEVKGLPSAFVCGIVHPILVLPEGKEMDDKIILHELLHLKYRDTLWSVLICFFKCIHWCNPLLMYCADVAINDLEARCDQRVMELLEGEERRDYGHILLSMVNEKYAKTPGTTCVSNGGKNIRNRIEAIVRFKKYPVGMELVSVCAIIVLAFSTVIGVQASTVYDSGNSLRLSVASARSTPCTTAAGAFDTYGKAILEQNGMYRMMCAPESMQEDLAHEMYQKDKEGRYPRWDCGLPAWPNTENGYHIYNLENYGENAYEALLVVELNYPPDGQAEEEGMMYLAVQTIRVEKESGRWVVIPQEEFQAMEVAEQSLYWGCTELPGFHYTGTTSDICADVKVQTIYMVDNSIQSATHTDLFGFWTSSAYYDTTPKPGAQFTTMVVSHSESCTHLGTESEREKITQIGLSVAPVYEGEERPEFLTAATGGTSGGSSSQGESWSGRNTQSEWGPTIEFGGGGSTSFEPDLDTELPQYYAANLYINNTLAAEMDLYPQEGVE